MIAIFMDLQTRARTCQPLPLLSDSGFRVFSQFEEDGYLLYLAAVLELEPKLFVDIGSSNGINSNCANPARRKTGIRTRTIDFSNSSPSPKETTWM